MKFLFPFLLLMANSSFTAKANDFNYSILHNSKIAAIDAALNGANSFEEIKAVSLKMSRILFKNFNDTCPPPKSIDYKALCADIGSKAKVPEKEQEFYEYTYERRILQLACVNIGVDDEETTKRKLVLFWNKYKKNCKCDSVEFNVQNGNILKFAISQNMPTVIETLASYGLDINFIHPADGLNLLDYIIQQIGHLKKLLNSEGSIKVYEEYKAGVIGLGGKSNKK